MKKKIRAISVMIFFAAATFFCLMMMDKKVPTVSVVDQSKFPGFGPNSPLRSIASVKTSNTGADAVASERGLPASIRNYLPVKIPSELNSRFEQRISSEDDRYITTRLFLDNRAMEEYYFKWQKNAKSVELVAGELPEVKTIAASFPSAAEMDHMVRGALDAKTKVLNQQEIWILDSAGVLYPRLKVEVQFDSPKTSGHEYWFYDLQTKKRIKKIDGDRT